MTLDDVIEHTTLLEDQRFIDEYEEVRRTMLGSDRATQKVIVEKVPGQRWFLEIEAIAVIRAIRSALPRTRREPPAIPDFHRCPESGRVPGVGRVERPSAALDDISAPGGGHLAASDIVLPKASDVAEANDERRAGQGTAEDR